MPAPHPKVTVDSQRGAIRSDSASVKTGAMKPLAEDVERRLEQEPVVWFVSVRANGSPHVTPVWFVYTRGTWWIATARRNIKVGNVEHEDQVSLALPDTGRPVVAEGRVRVHQSDFPEAVAGAFANKYGGWDIASVEPDGPRVLFEVVTDRWLLAG